MILISILEIQLSIMRCAVNPNRCIYNSCNETNDLICIPTKKRRQIMQKERVFVPQFSRACKDHFENSSLNEFDVGHFNYTKGLIEEMVDLLRDTKSNDVEVNQNEYDVSKLALTYDSFIDLVSLLPSLKQSFSGNKKKTETALKMFLTRMRAGDTYETIARSYGSSMSTVTKYINVARESLQKDFVPKFLGFENLSREF